MIKRIGHLAFVVQDMETSLAYYSGVLGFQKAFELRKKDNEPWIVYIKVGTGQFIELFYGGTEKLPGGSTGFSHVCLEVENIQTVAAHLRAHGAPLNHGSSQGLDLNWQCWSHDPDGNRIEFMQMNPESPQMKA
ncbi:MAG: VOC family protein [Bacilli bacterium]